MAEEASPHPSRALEAPVVGPKRTVSAFHYLTQFLPHPVPGDEYLFQGLGGTDVCQRVRTQNQ